MHRSRLSHILIDAAPDRFDATVSFWSGALGRAAEPADEVYTSLGEWGRDRVNLALQRLGSGDGRVHLDLDTDDPDAEVARLEGLGATRVELNEGCQVMRDPAGSVFCVVPREPGSLDDTDATVWD